MIPGLDPNQIFSLLAILNPDFDPVKSGIEPSESESPGL